MNYISFPLHERIVVGEPINIYHKNNYVVEEWYPQDLSKKDVKNCLSLSHGQDGSMFWSFKSCLHSPDKYRDIYLFIIRDAQQIVGWLFSSNLSFVDTKGPQVNVYVCEKHRRQKVGKTLLHVFLERYEGDFLPRVSEGRKGSLPYNLYKTSLKKGLTLPIC